MAKRAEVEARRNDVKELLLAGKSSQHIYNFIMTKHSVSKSVVIADITIVYGEIKQYLSRNIEDVLATHIGRYEKVYEMCMDYGNARDAMKALESIEKLLKMHQQQPLIQFNQLNLEAIDTPTLLDTIQKLRNENTKG